MTFTEMNHYVFTNPISPDGKVFFKSSPRGCKSTICPEDCLGLTLAWTRTRGGQFALNLIFDMTSNNFGMNVEF